MFPIFEVVSPVVLPCSFGSRLDQKCTKFDLLLTTVKPHVKRLFALSECVVFEWYQTR